MAQEALARAFERWRTVAALDRPGAWLQRVAVNLAIASRRRRRVRERSAFSAESAAASEPLDQDLLSALRALSPAQRAAVVLRFYADLSIDETARALGKRPGTIRALTSQGVGRLRELLPRQEVSDEP